MPLFGVLRGEYGGCPEGAFGAANAVMYGSPVAAAHALAGDLRDLRGDEENGAGGGLIIRFANTVAFRTERC